MKNKELIMKEINRIGLKKIIEAYTRIEGRKESAIRTAIDRGKISSVMAYDLESITQLSALFWIFPTLYETNGNRRF